MYNNCNHNLRNCRYRKRYVLGRPESFFRFMMKYWMHNIFRSILFCRITYDPFCSIKIKITMFDRLGFIIKDVSVKEKHFSDNLIDRESGRLVSLLAMQNNLRIETHGN